MKNYLNLPAPAKLNLFLHVVGRKPDGMHLLESVFHLIDLCDYLDFEELPEGRIERAGDITWEAEKDLCVRAARALQKFCPQKGVRITVRKHIPAGAGMGGGSSDAATTLIALNRLWGLNLKKEELIDIGAALGADIPFFIFGCTAFTYGIGEKMIPLASAPFAAHIIYPGICVPTAEIFAHPDLTRNTKPIKIADFSGSLNFPAALAALGNDLEPVARNLYEPVDRALKMLRNFGNAQMTGSGSAVFSVVKLTFDSNLAFCLPRGWQHWYVKSLEIHPLCGWTKSESRTKEVKGE